MLKVTSRLAAEEPFVSQSNTTDYANIKFTFDLPPRFFVPFMLYLTSNSFFFFHIESTYNLPTLKPQPSRWGSEVNKGLHHWGEHQLGPAIAGTAAALDEFGKNKLGLAVGEVEKALDDLARTNWALLFGRLENHSTSSERRTLAHQSTELVNGSKNILEKQHLSPPTVLPFSLLV